jgi:RimJ/RimL family protein N-acetyltransferase
VHVNSLGQPVGAPVPDWSPPSFPPHTPLQGRLCALVPLSAAHAEALWSAYARDEEGRNWTYLPHGPYERAEDFARWVAQAAAGSDPQFYAVLIPPRSAESLAWRAQPDRPAGIASYLRIAPAAGSIEVGHIHFSPLLQHTPASTEAMYLMMRRVFELGYRRYEWKCDALNAPSRRAAQRLGFSYEGVFRQALVMKGRNRDTAWYACIDREWPALRTAYERWLDPANFGADGRQRVSLGSLTGHILVARG